MCYSNCPYEVWGGDNWGDCAKPSMQGKPGAHCYDNEEGEVIDPEEDEDLQ